MVGVYGESEKENRWDSSRRSVVSGQWFIFGDFNIVLDQFEEEVALRIIFYSLKSKKNGSLLNCMILIFLEANSQTRWKIYYLGKD